MLQQTRMPVVLPRYTEFLQRFPTLQSLAGATEDSVTAAWSGLGYYRRARMLRSGANAIFERFDGRLPDTVDELMTIDGIGRYTAGAIASIAYDRRAPIVDGNIARIISRLFATHRDAWPLATDLVNAAKSPRVFNQALMEIGSLICRPRNPQCDACPLSGDCRAYQQRQIARYPRVAKKAMKALRVALYVITDRQGRVLLRRERGPLMGGMFHLPNALFARRSPVAGRPRSIGSFKHTITNRRIEFVVYRTATGRRRPTGKWVAPDDLPSLPHPSYVPKALRLAGIIR